MLRREWWVVVAALALASVACSAVADVSSGSADPDGTIVATELAPSQTTPDTTTAPELPPPCDPAALTFAQARPPTDGDRTDGRLVIALVNNGGVRCEAHLGSSPRVDADMEPDVWLDPGASAELLVAVEDSGCAVAPLERLVLDVNGDRVSIAIEPVAACGLALIALYPT